MAYTDFTLEKIERQFGVTNRTEALFPTIKKVKPSKGLRDDLEEGADLLLRTEKARSEWVVVPVLRELRKTNDRFFTIHSGEILDADKDTGLYGECDFILSRTAKTYTINLPILTIVEAKKNDIDLGIPQCAAQLIGASMYNQQRKKSVDVLYGCVTTGDDWKFMLLKDQEVVIDEHTYHLGRLDEVLGVFQLIIDYYKQNVP